MRFLSLKDPRVLSAWLPAVVVFVVMAFAVYTPNADEYGRAFEFLSLFALTAAGAYAVAWFGLSLLSEKYRTTTALALGLLGVFIYFSDIIAPLQVGEIMDGDEISRIQLSVPGVIGEGLLLGVLSAVIFWKNIDKDKWVRVLGWGSLLLVLSSSVTGVYSVATTAIKDVKKNPDAAAPPALPGSQNKVANVYHIVFDTYGHEFLKDVETLGLQDVFSGFVHFPHNVSNSDYTQVSIPLVFYGNSFKAFDYPFLNWRGYSMSQGYLKEFVKSGVRISQYQTRFMNEPIFDRNVFGKDLKISISEIGGSEFGVLSFYDLLILRAVPSFVQAHVFRGESGPLTRMFAPTLTGQALRGPRSVTLFNRLLEDEDTRTGRGEYVFAHVSIPHSPYNLTRECELSRSHATTYKEQSYCAITLMTRLIAKLKRANRFDDSLIIFQGDHGLHYEKTTPDSRGFLKNPGTLLLLKPIRADRRKALQVSALPTSLFDVAPTVFAQVGLRAPWQFVGRNLLGESGVDSERTFSFFTYKMPYNRKTEELREWSYSRKDGWKKVGDIFPLR